MTEFDAAWVVAVLMDSRLQIARAKLSTFELQTLIEVIHKALTETQS